MSARPFSPRSTHSPSRLSQAGWGLTETLLTLGALSVMSVAMYAVFKPTDASAQVKVEQDNLRVLSSGIDRSQGLLGSFQGLSTADLLDGNLAPARMRMNGELRTVWGAPVSVASHQVNVANDSYVVSYPATPSDVCAPLASAMARDTHDILVGGESVFAGGRLDPGLAAQRCGAGNATMDFIFHSGLVSGQAVAAAPVVLPSAPPTITPPPGTPPILTIPGTPEVDPVTPGTPAMPPPASPPPVLPPPATPPSPPLAPVIPAPPSSPPPPPVSPPGAVCSPPASWVNTDSRTQSCAGGYYGVRTQQRTQTVSSSCPEAWGAPVESRTPWGGWVDITTTCTACSPTTGTRLDWQARSQACPAGQSGLVTWEEQRNQSRTGTYNCPAGTASLPAPVWGGWVDGSWTGTTRNTVNACENNCVVPNPATQSNVETRTATQALSCPAGQAGTITQTRPEQRTQTRTASCPSPTGPVDWTGWSAWSAWSSAGPWATVSDTCEASPPVSYSWQHEVTRQHSGSTQADRTQYTVLSVNGLDTVSQLCFSNPPAGSVVGWRGAGWMPGLLTGKPGCECNSARDGWYVEWNQSEYFADDVDLMMICRAQ